MTTRARKPTKPRISGWWSSKARSEKAAILAIAVLAFGVVAAAAVLVAFRSGLLFEFKDDPVAEQTQHTIQAAVERELHAGDARARVVEFFERNKLDYDYDPSSMRYKAVAYRSLDGAHQVVLEIWVDDSGRFLLGKATDELTFF